MENVIHYNFELAAYFRKLGSPVGPRRAKRQFSAEQLAALGELMAEAAAVNDQLERIYQRAVAVLGEENVEDEMDRWSWDAIFNHYNLVPTKGAA
jgi:hypothetical protein